MQKILLIISVLLIIASCCRIERTGSPEASKDIKTSMKNDLYYSKYTANKQFFKYKKDNELKIEEAWIEKLWTYEANKCKDIVLPKHGTYQFVIKIENINKTEYRMFWELRESETNQILHPNMTCLSFRGAQLDSDTLKFIVKRYNSSLFEQVKTPEIETGIIIDSIVFTKVVK